MTRSPGTAQIGLVLAALALSVPAGAQNTSEPRVWASVSVQGRGASGWQWAVDSLGRTKTGTRAMDLLAGSVAVRRDLTRRLSVGGGYVYGAAFPDVGSLREHRVFQELAWRPGVTGLSLRTRLEERFVTGQTLFRVRQQVRTAWPLGMRSTVRGVVAAEVFATVGGAAQVARGLDAVRTFAGVEQSVGPRSGVQVGYVHVYWPRAQAAPRHGHVLSVRLVVSL